MKLFGRRMQEAVRAAEREDPPANDNGKDRANRKLWETRMRGRQPNETTQVTFEHDRKLAERIAQIKAEYLRDNPEDMEGAEMYSGMVKFLDDDKRLREMRREEVTERLRLVKELTTYNARWTRYVHEHSENREFMEKYWGRLESLARRQKAEKAFSQARSGILTQAATLEIFKRLGHNPNLSEPDEDAYRKIDMWVDNTTPVQIKTIGGSDKVTIIETDTATPLHIETGKGENATRISAATTEEILGFCLKLDEYARVKGQTRFRGLFIILPKNGIDRVTGRPTVRLVTEIEQKLKAMGYSTRPNT